MMNYYMYIQYCRCSDLIESHKPPGKTQDAELWGLSEPLRLGLLALLAATCKACAPAPEAHGTLREGPRGTWT